MKRADVVDFHKRFAVGPNTVLAISGDFDLGVMKNIGFAVSPANGVPEVKEVSHYITTRKGGEGVLRELGEFVLRAQGKWKPLVDKVGNKGWG